MPADSRLVAPDSICPANTLQYDQLFYNPATYILPMLDSAARHNSVFLPYTREWRAYFGSQQIGTNRVHNGTTSQRENTVESIFVTSDYTKRIHKSQRDDSSEAFNKVLTDPAFTGAKLA